MRDIDPGSMKWRVVFERQTQAADTFTAQTWCEVCTVQASIQSVRSSERMLADSMRASLTHTVLVRWSPALAAVLESAQWRIRFCENGAVRHLGVVGPVRPHGFRQWLIFDTVEGLADGH